MKKALVIGAALSGVAVSKLLAQKKYDVYLTDLQPIKEKEALLSLGIKVYEGSHPECLKENDYALIVKNPGIKDETPFVSYFKNRGYFIYNELEVANMFVNYRYGSITGTNGKTTTTTLLGEFLKTLNPSNEAVGNIGLPLSEIVSKHEKDNLACAVEISAFQLLGIKNFHPEVSVIMNLTPDHIDYFHSLEAYYKAKTLVYKNQGPGDWFLLNLDDKNCLQYVKEVPCKVVTFSLIKEADLCLRNNKVYLFNNELFEANTLNLPGKHNLLNAMVASAMAYKMGVDISNIRKVIANFKGVKHRIQYVATKNGVKYYNDSKGTNPDSTIVALKAFAKPVILLAGGYDKKTGFKNICPYLNKVKEMIVFGDTKKQLLDLYPQAIVKNNLTEALQTATKIAKNGDVVLLSPMCASWDQYNSYEERGDEFIRLVNDL